MLTKILLFEIGGVKILCTYNEVIDINEDDAVFPFLIPSGYPNIVLDIKVTDSFQRNVDIPDNSSPSWCVKRNNGMIYFDFFDKGKFVATLTIDSQFRNGIVLIDRCIHVTKILPVYVFWPIISGFLIIENRGFFLHGAVVKHNDEAVIITGDSGAGKSTLSRLLNGNFFEKYGDDRLIIAKDPAKDDVFCYSTPFDLKLDSWINQSVRINAIIQVFHSENGKNTMVPKVWSDNLNRVVFSNFFPFFMPSLIPKYFKLFREIMSSIPLYHYSFVPDKSAVNEILKTLF